MSVQYEKAQRIVSKFVQTVRAAQIQKGYTEMEASAYTLGYLESHLVGILAIEISDNAAKRVLNQMSLMTGNKQKEIDNATV